jgi:O-antigen ligase
VIEPHASSPSRPLLLALASLLGILVLVPPEVHPESLVGCALLAILVVLVAATRRPDGFSAARSASLAGGIALAILGARAAAAPGAAVEPVATLVFGVCLGLAAVSDRRSVENPAGIPAAVAAAGGILGLRAVWESVLGLSLMAERVAEFSGLPDQAKILARLEEGRAYAGFATPAALGGVLALALTVSIGAAWDARGKARAAYAVAAACQAAGLLASRSLTAAGGLAAAVLLALVVRRGPLERRRAPAAAVLAVMALLVAIVALRGPGALGIGGASPWSLRAGNVRIALEMAADHPWLGVGPGGFGESFPAYRRATDNESRHAHAMPAEWVAEGGVPLGLVATVVLYVVLLGPLFRRESEVAAWRRGASIGLAALAVQNLADFTILFPSVLGVAAVLRGTLSPSPVSRPARAAPIVATVGLALVASSLLALAGASAWGRDEARGWLVEGRPDRAAPPALRAVRLAPWRTDASLLAAQALLASDPRRAAEILDAAVTWNPARPALRDLRARARRALGDVTGACSDWAEASRLYPADPSYRTGRDRCLDDLAKLSRGSGS